MSVTAVEVEAVGEGKFRMQVGGRAGRIGCRTGCTGVSERQL